MSCEKLLVWPMDAARRIQSERGGRSAPDGLNRREVEVRPQEFLGGAERDVAEFEGREAVLLDLQELGSSQCERKAADNKIGVALPPGGLGVHARYVA